MCPTYGHHTRVNTLAFFAHSKGKVSTSGHRVLENPPMGITSSNNSKTLLWVSLEVTTSGYHLVKKPTNGSHSEDGFFRCQSH